MDALFSKQMDALNPNLVKQFIQKNGEYLNEINQDGIRYLGKEMGSIVSFQQLELSEANIYSLLKKLVPDFPYNECPLYVLATPA